MSGTVIETPATPAVAPDASDNAPEIPAKFQNEDGTLNQAALLKSYGELEKKQSQGAQEPAPTETPEPVTPNPDANSSEETPDPNATPQDVQVNNLLSQQGLSLDDLVTEYEANDKSLTDESYGKLASAGFDRETVDDYIAGRQSRVNATRAEWLEPVGGEDGLKTLQEWASQNYTQEQADKFNELSATGDKDKIQLALVTLKADYDKAQGSPKPNLITNVPNLPSQSTDAYASQAEWLRDMANPLYKTDPAFQDKVKAKLGRSKI